MLRTCTLLWRRPTPPPRTPTQAGAQFPPGMAEHLQPWAGWLLRLAGLLLACCQLALQWRRDPQLQDRLQDLPMLRLLSDTAALTSLTKVHFYCIT